jgi:type IV pilus assembly protein PilW
MQHQGYILTMHKKTAKSKKKPLPYARLKMKSTNPHLLSQKGITLLELLVAMVVALIAIGAIYDVYAVQVRNHRSQKVTRIIQQNLRAALTILQQEIRKAGYDPHDSRRFGIVDIRRYDLVSGSRLNSNGQPSLSYTCDIDENGRLDPRNGGRNREHSSFKVADVHNNGRISLTYDNGGGRRPVAKDIHAMGLAYGVDVDGDDVLDTWKQGLHPIWAVDSDNDNRLDTHLDVNDDGRINTDDDTDGDGRITARDGAPIEPAVDLDRIKAVQVWLFAQSAQPVRGHYDNRIYIVADRIIPAASDGRVCGVLSTIIACRNL